MALTPADFPRRTRWLANDGTRIWFVMPLIVPTALVVRFVPWVASAIDDEPIATLLVFYAMMLLAYSCLTLLAFAGLSGDRLNLALAESWRHQQKRPAWARRLSMRRTEDGVGGDGSSWPVLLALGSLVVAVWLIISDSTRETPFLVVISMLMVVFAWGGSLVAYAVHVARLDTVHGGLRFPGATTTPEAERTFSDYLYLAVGLQAAFGPSDVQVMTHRMRRTLSGHMLVGWIFNTVVVAALVSILVSLN